MRVEVLTDRPEERFAAGAVVHVEGTDRSLTVAAGQPVADGPGWWVSFREVRNRAAAEALRDAFLEVTVDRAVDLPAGQAYWHEVVGSEVRDRAGRSLGRVSDVYRAGETEVYVVVGGPLGDFDLPAVQGIVLDFAPERGEIVVDEAILDLGGAPVDTRPNRERKPHRWSRHGKGRGSPSQPSGEPSEGSDGPGEEPGGPGEGSDGPGEEPGHVT